jgi:diguanylate cyclase (GGDEF)-like protein
VISFMERIMLRAMAAIPNRFPPDLERQFRAQRAAALAEVNSQTFWMVAFLVLSFSAWDWYVDPARWDEALWIRSLGAIVILGSGLMQRMSQRADWAPLLAKARFTAAVLAVAGALAILDRGFLVGIAGLISVLLSAPYIAIDRRDVLVMNAAPLAGIALVMAVGRVDGFAAINAWIFIILSLAVSLMLARVLEASNRRAFALEQQLSREARTDALTGLRNRRALEETAQAELKRAARQGTPIAVVLGDVDHFKEINDRHGHDVGDRVITAVGAHLIAVARESDVLGRWGGEEFLAILPGSDEPSAVALAERMRIAIEAAQLPLPDGGRVTISLGVASLPPGKADAWSWDRLVQRADRAMYRAKKDGRNRVEPAGEDRAAEQVALA